MSAALPAPNLPPVLLQSTELHLARSNTWIKNPLVPIMGSVALEVAGMAAKNPDRGLRDRLPEPWDVMDHMGNLAPSVGIGYAGALAGVLICNRLRNSPPLNRMRKIAYGAAAFSGVTLNSVFELSRDGGDAASFLGHSEPRDFAYGLIGTVIGGALMRIRNRPLQGKHRASDPRNKRPT